MELFKKTELDPSLLAEVRRLFFQTRFLAEQGLAGAYKSAFRGRGIEFEEVREYVPGDDIRSIDWKVTARSRRPFVKNYREERELTVMIAVDVSGSMRTGTRAQLREELIAKIGALLTLIALNNNDHVGLVTYSNRVETYHPPRKARSAVWRILHEVLSPGPGTPRTDIAGLCSFLSNVLKRSSIVFLLSDFLDQQFEHSLALLARRHDVTAIRVQDPAEFQVPSAELIAVRDPETGNGAIIDTASTAVRRAFKDAAERFREEQRSVFRRNRVGLIDLRTDQPFIDPVKRYFYLRKLNPHLVVD